MAKSRGGPLKSYEVQNPADADAVANEPVNIIAGLARVAVAACGRFVTAVSGGHTSWQIFRALAGEDGDWGAELARIPDVEPFT